jgi:hypothetical protein
MFQNVYNAISSPSAAVKATSKTSTTSSTATVAVAPALEGGYTNIAVTSGTTAVAVNSVIEGVLTSVPGDITLESHIVSATGTVAMLLVFYMQKLSSP